MWVVNHHWQDDDYKGTHSGIHTSWGPFEHRKDAITFNSKKTRELVETRVKEDDSLYIGWLKKTWPKKDDRPQDIDDLDDDEVDVLHAFLFQGEFIPGLTEWFEVRHLRAP